MSMGERTVQAEQPERIYQDRIDQFTREQSLRQLRSRRVAWLRALVFVGTIILVVKYVATSWLLGVGLPILLFALFIYLVKESIRINREVRFLGEMIRVNREELKTFEWDFTAFPEGNEFQDYHHPYSYDIDLFGKHSLYRMLVRAGTEQGEKQLAEEMMDPPLDPVEIRSRQVAVQELTPLLEWRQKLLATARLVDESEKESGLLHRWVKSPDRYANNRWIKTALWILPAISLLLPVGLILGWVPYYAALYYIIPLLVVLIEAKAITDEQNRVGRLLKHFRKYQDLLEQVEQQDFKAPLLVSMKQQLIKEGIPASHITKKLARILWGLEVRMNLLMAFILNAFVLWDIRTMIRLERWRAAYGTELNTWLQVIARFESLNGLANQAFNRQDLIYPEIREGNFILEMEAAGHPLIRPEVRVDNSIKMVQGDILLVTGANMAGKSTLLRMVGINLIMGRLGAPVCAKSMAFVPIRLRTSVRTLDSLGDDESYFYAELKKLSAMVTQLEKGDPLFVIVDEMLKGTNSHDKHTGSKGLIKRLIQLGANGMIATHDVELGSMTNEFPNQLHTRCFEVSIEGDQLKFDYILRNGVSKSLNATFLMKKASIINTKD